MPAEINLTRERSLWHPLAVVATCALGVASRKIAIGWSVWDHDLGDVLYPVLVYLLLIAVVRRLPPMVSAVTVAAVMVAIELFQLTGLGSEWEAAGSSLLRIFPLLFGTQFAWWDFVAYAVGIVVIWALDASGLFGWNHTDQPELDR